VIDSTTIFPVPQSKRGDIKKETNSTYWLFYVSHLACFCGDRTYISFFEYTPCVNSYSLISAKWAWWNLASGQFL